MRAIINRKLDVTYSALAGTTGGCVDFYGITKLPKYETQESSNSDDAILCLVFNRASEGNLRDVLERHNKKNDWAFIIETLTTVGSGLDGLHKHGVAHR